ncbi:glycosyltransferase [Bordetella hinzii]|uniref:glycosyltransferase n=1 Tax=Bordetella hinzii TaxID=103855 RepID=UPI001FD2D0F4|nr:glycosyltransferase [Bordetella hinzii]
MTMLPRYLQAWLGEPWLALSRQLTFHALSWRLRPRAVRPAYEARAGSMLYVAASSRPYHVSGYTSRTQEVIRAFVDAGADVHALTRPGYPWDRRDRHLDAEGLETTVDDVRYQHVRHPSNNRPVLQYAMQAARVVADVAVRQRAALIHAASNHVNALPALLAARRLGIPFQYEMRGLWELTRISRTPHYEDGQAYKQGLQLEGLVARNADRVCVISRQLGQYAQDMWGVIPQRMALLPNCVDTDRIRPESGQDADTALVGYAGTLIGYEGLDTLVEAIGLLARQGHPVKALLIGDGEARASLQEQVGRLGLEARIQFAGRMTPEAARSALARCSLVCMPRKPFKVCEIVPPLKLVEALAVGKPVIVPDLPVFRDELGEHPAGWFFRAGDSADLARVVSAALRDRGALSILGQRARAHAVAHRQWRDFVIKVLPGTLGAGAVC